MLIAQITDTHIKLPGKLAYRRVDTAAFLRRCVDELCRLDPRPELIVITGDLVDFGLEQEYARLIALLAPLSPPIVVIAGNHDDRDAMRKALTGHDYLPPSGFLQFALNDRFPLRLIGLDTVIAGQGRGELCAERLAWLEQTLAERPGDATLILMHHPPFLSGIGHMDAIGLGGAGEFERIVAAHPQIQGILCGHLHRHLQTLVGGRRTMTAPGPAHQVTLDLHAGAPSQFSLEPPGYLLHHWIDHRLVSHHVNIGDYAGPYPFFDASGALID